jgi:hypothetical protein
MFYRYLFKKFLLQFILLLYKKLHFREYIFYAFTLAIQKRISAYPFTLKD